MILPAKKTLSLLTTITFDLSPAQSTREGPTGGMDICHSIILLVLSDVRDVT